MGAGRTRRGGPESGAADEFRPERRAAAAAGGG